MDLVRLRNKGRMKEMEIIVNIGSVLVITSAVLTVWAVAKGWR
jgi:hypothetical protein